MEEGDMGIGGLTAKCIVAAAASPESVERWRRQRRTLERLPSQLADALLRRLLRRRLIYPSLLEIFQHCVEHIDLAGESCVDAEWMAYLGGFRYLCYLSLADCRSINNSALWPVTGMSSLKELNLSRCSKINDAGIRHVLSLQKLEKLHISETGVTSNGVMLLSSLRDLQLLDVGGIAVTDEALSSLKVLTKLEYLDIWGSKISNNGVATLKLFAKLSFLNLAWTNVTKLPCLPSITYLNMSNCTIHSLFDAKCSSTAALEKLFLLGATIINTDEAFSNVEASSITFLDVTGSSISDFHFLVKMRALKHLDLKSITLTDNLIEYVASVGANLKYLDIGYTKLTSQGVSLIAGNVPTLETLCLSHTEVDDDALTFISMMPSLRVIDLSSTKVRGFTYRGGDNSDKILSLSVLEDLHHLESLNLEETQVRDEALYPLSSLQGLSSLYLKSDFLSDVSLNILSSLSNLMVLGLCNAVISTSGLLLFIPPRKLRVLDLSGCWLLAKDTIVSFCKIHPQIKVKHEHVETHAVDKNVSTGSYRFTKASELRYKGVKLESSSHTTTFSDERIKYSKEDLLDLQLSPLSSLALNDIHVLPKELRRE